MEILFRAKRKDNGKWVEGHFFADEGNKNGFIESRNGYNHEDTYYIRDQSGKDYFIDANTIGQFHGLTDCNGKKIFTGDILSLEGNDRIKSSSAGIVKYYKGCLVNFYGQSLGEDCFDYVYQILDSKKFQLQVIGNIFDNKSIIEESLRKDYEECKFENS